ncbi:MAG: hypothetical protein R3321_13015 [Nitrososphaeraceae archaeon]|nr:hypothetical protein [Nitrososphaeraceae archaeon]
MNNKNIVGSVIVGKGSDFIVFEKKNKRYLIEVNFKSLKELKNSTTPYGSSI